MRVRFLLALCLSAITWSQTVPADPISSARLLAQNGEYEKAAAAFQTIVEKDPTSSEAQAGLARNLLQAHKLDEADAAAKKAVAALPKSAVMQAAFGDVAFRTGHFADAESGYRTTLQLDPNSARGWFGMGRMFDMVSMHKQAKGAFAKARALDPEDKQIEESWLGSLPYSEQLEFLKSGHSDNAARKERIAFLEAVIQKKPWQLAGEVKPTEIKMLPYGREDSFVDSGPQFGSRPVARGFGLTVKLNDHASALLLLDTRTHGISIGTKLAEKAGVVKIADASSGAGDAQARGYLGWADKITIGGVEFHNCIIEISSKYDNTDDPGHIGTDIFEKFLVTIDFAEKKLLLAPLPTNPNAAANDDGPQDRYIAPEMQAYTRIYRFGSDLVMPVVISDKVPGNFILDTGSALTSMSNRVAEQITKVGYQEMFSISTISGVAGKRVLEADTAILQFGKVRVRADGVPVLDAPVGDSESTDIAGQIGMRTLVQMKTTIDYRDGLVNFQVYEFKKARE